jgi:hypothetical protein
MLIDYPRQAMQGNNANGLVDKRIDRRTAPVPRSRRKTAFDLWSIVAWRGSDVIVAQGVTFLLAPVAQAKQAAARYDR